MASFLPFANMPFTEKTELLFSMHLERFRPMEMLPIYDRSSPANASLYFIQSGNAAAFVDTRADSFAKRY